MERKPSLEKEKKNISNFLPKALIEEINKTYDDKNHNKSSFSLKEKELNSNINNNSINSINGIHNGFSLNNKNINLLNGSYQNMNISHILLNKLNMNNIHSESFINNCNNNSINFSNMNNYQTINNLDLNTIKNYLNGIGKINGIKNDLNSFNGINCINGINGNHIFKNGNYFHGDENFRKYGDYGDEDESEAYGDVNEKNYLDQYGPHKIVQKNETVAMDQIRQMGGKLKENSNKPKNEAHSVIHHGFEVHCEYCDFLINDGIYFLKSFCYYI